jgi:hypothetical protein
MSNPNMHAGIEVVFVLTQLLILLLGNKCKYFSNAKYDRRKHDKQHMR